ncbi:MAG: HIT domain-containing protein [Phycisphaerae bacterium]|nr:HIT domain-containing protein [Phycisphaerae bacterium]
MSNDSDQHPPEAGNVNLWAPWRIEYIQSLDDDDDTCFLCRYRDEPSKDAENLLLWRGRACIAVMNRFPYTGGHMLVAPLEHLAGLEDISAAVMCEMMEMVRDLQTVLTQAIGPHGFNVGMNIGRCAGAGLPGHLHMHVVPRWNGDTNFMSALGDIRVIPQALSQLYSHLRDTSEKLQLPKLS